MILAEAVSLPSQNEMFECMKRWFDSEPDQRYVLNALTKVSLFKVLSGASALTLAIGICPKSQEHEKGH